MLSNLCHRVAPRRRAIGFTLIELMAVVLIIGMMAGLAGVSLRGVLDRATLDDVAASLRTADASARQRAARFGRPLVMQFEEDRLQLHWGDSDGESITDLNWPDRYKIELSRPQRESRHERRLVRVNRSGRSGSYVLHVTDPQGESRWIVVCGLSGESGVYEDEQTAQDVQSLWKLKRLES